MTDEQVRIRIGTGRDKIQEIFEEEGTVTVIYTQGGQDRPITIEKSLIKDVYNIIQEMDVGEPYKSKYVYNKMVKKYNIKSEIILDKIKFLRDMLRKHNVPELTIINIIEELEKDDEFILMDWREMIGTREVKTSMYFKIYGAIRYLTEKGVISYNQVGTIVRLE